MRTIWRNPEEKLLTYAQTNKLLVTALLCSALDEPTRSITSRKTANRHCKRWCQQEGFCRAVEGPKAMKECQLGFETTPFNLQTLGWDEPTLTV